MIAGLGLGEVELLAKERTQLAVLVVVGGTRVRPLDRTHGHGSDGHRLGPANAGAGGGCGLALRVCVETDLGLGTCIGIGPTVGTDGVVFLFGARYHNLALPLSDRPALGALCLECDGGFTFRPGP